MRVLIAWQRSFFGLAFIRQLWSMSLHLGVHSGLHQGFERYTYLPPNAPFPFTEGARRVKIIDIFLRLWADLGETPGRYHRSSTEVFQQLKDDMLHFDGENWFCICTDSRARSSLFFEDKTGFRRAKKVRKNWHIERVYERLDGSLDLFSVVGASKRISLLF